MEGQAVLQELGSGALRILSWTTVNSVLLYIYLSPRFKSKALCSNIAFDINAV
jgi:hypothetical protein